MAQTPLTQNIVLVKAGVLGNKHVKLDNREALGWQLSSTISANRFFRNKNAAGMNAGSVQGRLALRACGFDLANVEALEGIEPSQWRHDVDARS